MNELIVVAFDRLEDAREASRPKRKKPSEQRSTRSASSPTVGLHRNGTAHRALRAGRGLVAALRSAGPLVTAPRRAGLEEEP